MNGMSRDDGKNPYYIVGHTRRSAAIAVRIKYYVVTVVWRETIIAAAAVVVVRRSKPARRFPPPPVDIFVRLLFTRQ